MTPTKPPIDVVAAVIMHKGHIYAVQRGEHKQQEISFKWEFPGGKVDPGENFKEALVREIREELETDISVGEKLISHTFEYKQGKPIHLHAYSCTLKRNGEGGITMPTLKEHIAERWVNTNEMGKLDWAGADVALTDLLKSLSF